MQDGYGFVLLFEAGESEFSPDLGVFRQHARLVIIADRNGDRRDGQQQCAEAGWFTGQFTISDYRQQVRGLRLNTQDRRHIHDRQQVSLPGKHTAAMLRGARHRMKPGIIDYLQQDPRAYSSAKRLAKIQQPCICALNRISFGRHYAFTSRAIYATSICAFVTQAILSSSNAIKPSTGVFSMRMADGNSCCCPGTSCLPMLTSSQRMPI